MPFELRHSIFYKTACAPAKSDQGWKRCLVDTLIRMCGCTDWSLSMLCAHTTLQEILSPDPFINGLDTAPAWHQLSARITQMFQWNFQYFTSGNLAISVVNSDCFLRHIWVFSFIILYDVIYLKCTKQQQNIIDKFDKAHGLTYWFAQIH